MIPDTQLTIENIPFVVHQVLKGVQTCQNKERQSKRSELYLRCGGGYDTESTTVTDSEGKPLFAFVYHIQLMINGSYIYVLDMRLLVLFLQALARGVKAMKAKKKQPKLILWCANLSHEYAFFKRQIAELSVTELFAKKERQPLKIVVCDCIEFRECIGLFGHSLEDIAKKHTKTQKLKGDLDYDLIRHSGTPLTDRELAYCINDVLVLTDFYYKFLRPEFLEKDKIIPLTSTGIVRSEVKDAFNEMSKEDQKKMRYEIRKAMPNREIYLLWRTFLFRGGLTHANILACNELMDKDFVSFDG